MAEIVSRSTVMAIKPESTEGTPVAPSAPSDYVRLQDDFDMSPAFETLESAELSASIGRSKSILGSENPTLSFSHYVRNSGVAGQAPDFGEMIKAAFGDEVVAGSEYGTVAASTEDEIKVDTGEGANFQRGQLLLVKDPVNGNSIRPVHSVSGDSLIPGFNLPAAPGSGVPLGKCVLYKPADAGHQSLTTWLYMGNKGAIQMMTGGRVTSLDIQADAGQLLNCSFALEGVGYYFNPVHITASNNKLDFDEGASDLAATIPPAWYKDPHELARAIENAMNAVGGDEYTVTYSDATGKYKIESDGVTLNLLWDSGSNSLTSIGSTIGFAVDADDSGATSYTADNAMDWSAPHTPAYDTADPIAAKNLEVLLGDAKDNTCISPASVAISVATPKTNKMSLCSPSGISGSMITSREVTVTISGYLEQYEAEKFRRFRENSETRFLFNFGTKTGGNWDEGRCGAVYIPTCSISSFDLNDTDGLVGYEITLTAYVDSSGSGEVYLGFV